MEERTTTVCTVCKQALPHTVEFFGPTAQNNSGLLPRCRACMRASHKKWRDKNPDKLRVISQRYHDKDPEASRVRRRAAGERNSAKNKQAILRRQREKRHANIEQTRAQANAYRRKHPETFRRAQQQWEENHPDDRRIRGLRRRRRARNVPATLTPLHWDFCLRYWHFACAVCGAQEGFMWTLAMDHWIPLASPICPGTIPGNILVLCHGIGGCNNSKHDNDPIAWLEQKLGKSGAKKKLQEIEKYFAAVRDIYG